MKTYKHLFEAMIERDFIEAAIKSASKGKRKRSQVQAILDNPEPVIDKIIEELTNKTWTPPLHKKHIIQEGPHRKERIIEKPIFDNEQIIHHMLVRRMRPFLEPQFYEFSCGCIPTKGPLLVKNTITRWIKRYQNNKFYVAELDIKKFYQNINTEILKTQLSRIFKDNNFLYPLFQVIDAAAPGLPLGYYTSPWLGNLYLTSLDRYILHTLHPDRYIRYMDNLFLFCDDKIKLHEIVKEIQEFCQNKLDLTIKDDWQVYQFEHQDPDGEIRGRAINCLGFIIHYNRVTMRKSLLKRIRAKANRIHKNKRTKLMDARAMTSYSGWLIQTDTYNYYKKYIKPNVSFRYCKEMISKNKKRSNKNDELEANSQQRRSVAR